MPTVAFRNNFGYTRVITLRTFLLKCLNHKTGLLLATHKFETLIGESLYCSCKNPWTKKMCKILLSTYYSACTWHGRSIQHFSISYNEHVMCDLWALKIFPVVGTFKMRKKGHLNITCLLVIQQYITIFKKHFFQKIKTSVLTVRPHGIVILFQVVPYGSVIIKNQMNDIEVGTELFQTANSIRLFVRFLLLLIIFFQPRNQTTIKSFCVASCVCSQNGDTIQHCCRQFSLEVLVQGFRSQLI